jgi:serine/threonine protein kinase
MFQIQLFQKKFQYGVSADVYSLTIIIFELFSGNDPFPGTIGQIFEAKRLDKKPNVPSDFPSHLKELVLRGWSFNPKERPPVKEFKAALNKMLTEEEIKATEGGLDSPSFSYANLSKEIEQPGSHQEIGLPEIQKEELCIESETVPKEDLGTNLETGE